MVFYCVQHFVSSLALIIHHPHVIQKQWSNSLNVNYCDMLWINVCVFSFCCVCRLSWWCGARGASAAERDATALWTVGRCQRRHRQPKKPTWWQVQPRPGLRPLFFIRTLFYFLKIKTPHHSLPPHHSVTFCQPSPTSHALPLSHPWTPVSSPSTLKPFVWILFSIKIRKLLTKALYVSLPLPSPFSFQPIL